MPGIILPGNPLDPASATVSPAKSDSPDVPPTGFTDPPNVYKAWAELVSALGFYVPHHVNRTKAATRRLARAVA